MEKKLRDLLEETWDAATANWCVPGAPDFDEWIEEVETSKQQTLNIGDVSTRESLSDYAHEAWSGWMKYMFSKAEKNINGTWLMPKWAVERWQRQMNTKYTELPEEERESDREEADKMLNIIHGC